MRIQNRRYSLLFSSLLIAILGAWHFEEAIAAAPIFPVNVTCLPATPLTGKGSSPSFTLTRGTSPHFTCSIKNQSATEDFSGFLLGKATSGKNAPAASSNTVTLKKNTTTEATLEFPAVLQSGTYQYVFTLFDTTTKKPLAAESSLSGVLAGESQANIATITLDRDHYDWSAPLTLSVSVTLPQGTNFKDSPLALTVGLQDQQEKPCATLAENLFLSQSDAVLKLTLPAQGKCTNTLVVSLKTKIGTLVDKKVVALPLPEQQATPSQSVQTAPPVSSSSFVAAIPQGLLAAVIITTMLMLALAGYFFIKKKRSPL